MPETIYKKPVPLPSEYYFSGSVSVRSPDETAASACFVLGTKLDLRVRDVRTDAPLRFGAVVKSCAITVDDQTDIFQNPEADLYPRASRERESYKDDASAKGRQKKRFYQYVSSCLRRLGYRTAAVTSAYSSGLGDEMKRFYSDQGDESIDDINVIVKDIDELLHNALMTRDHVSDIGQLVIGLPHVSESKTVKVKIEFYDIKFLLEEDLKEAFEAHLGQSVDADPSSIISSLDVVYDRASATWPTGGADPDVPANESTQARSNWCIEVETKTGHHRVKFRNFVEFELTVDPESPRVIEKSLWAMTWCQPVWHEEEMFLRQAFEIDPDHPIEKTAKRSHAAINSLHPTNGQSGYNYGIFGVFRSSGGYYRLHTGLDVTGRNREGNGHLRTPVFGVTGGRLKRYTANNIYIHHGDEKFTRYVHMSAADLYPASNTWVKAGSILGKMGRNGIDGPWPTHVHFETLIDTSTGWGYNSFVELPSGEAKLRAAAYPVNPAVWTNTLVPKFIKYQYGDWVRSPQERLEAWIDEQLGDGAWEWRYKTCMPASWPAWHTPPCRCEFGPGNTANPGACTASCVAADGSAVAAQVNWAKGCWAVKSHHDPRNSACPGFVKNGLAASFTKDQRIQFHVWQLGQQVAAFDGSLGSAARIAIEAILTRLAAGSVFRASVATKTTELIAAEAASKNVPASSIAETAEHRRLAIKELLKVASHRDQLLADLEAVAPFH